MLSNEESRRAFLSCDLLLQKRLSISPEKLVFQKQEDLSKASRDGYREDKFLLKLATRRSHAEIANNLTNKKPLRLAMDMVFYTNEQRNPFFSKEAPLSSLFNIQNMAAFLLLRLSFLKRKQDCPFPIPAERGNGIFFKPNTNIDLSPLFTLPSQMFYLIGFSEGRSLYTFNEKDPNNHILKELGYAFGDPLEEKYHPLVYR